MSNSLSRSIAPMLFLALTLPATVLAQAPGTAALNGVVLDASGKPVAGYPMKVATAEWGEVVMRPTEDDGSFVVDGLPPGNYEFRVFEPGGATTNPIASKKVTVAEGQAQRIEIRLGSDKPSGAGASNAAAGLASAGTTVGASGVNWTAIQIAVVVLAAVFLIFYVARSQRRPA